MVLRIGTPIIADFFYYLLDIREPLMAGVWASMGSTLGKLSGSQVVVGDGYLLWALLLIMMITVNTWGCRCYLRALDKSTEAVTPTVISSATSFLFSAVIEVVVFNGKTSLKWWLGTIFILQGIALVARNPKLPVDDKN
ncbi:uncharacterized protein LOC123659786 [Melitaea cinxia]|uniref:uncharacterized protein LOC123659786 n=1 Tax=Melitaea cinxia TaxID=113334 RepID=UPI001E2731C5|nr:uncharacterized protein LOC123659786 [Melitaea cinxia]